VQELEAAGFKWLIDRSEPEPPLERKSDEVKMTRAARLGAPRGGQAAIYEGLLLRDLENWVSSEVFHRPLKALVDALLMYRTISGAHAMRVVAEVDAEMLKEIDELERKGNDGES
jgi:hypothetical protein